MKVLANTPSISVVMSVFNAGTYLHDAVGSILSQTYPDFEFIVVNDGSTDGSGDVLESFATRDVRVRVVHQENRGLTPSLNRALRLARGPYVARMDADDVSEIHRFETQQEAINRDPRCVLVTSDLSLIDESGQTIGTIRRESHSDVAGWHLLFFNFVGGHGQVMYRRDVALSQGGYDESLSFSQDYDLWCKLWRAGHFVFLPDVLYRYRWHQQNLSRTRSQEQLASSVRTSCNHIRNQLGITIESETMKLLRAFWYERRPRVAAMTLATHRANEVDRAIRRLYQAYLETQEGRALTRKQRFQIRDAISWRYMRWARRSLTYGPERHVAALVRRAIVWSPFACTQAALRLGYQASEGMRSSSAQSLDF